MGSEMQETAQQVIEGPKQFFKDGFQFINRCKKPDQQGKETSQMADYNINMMIIRILKDRPSCCYGFRCSWCSRLSCQGNLNN